LKSYYRDVCFVKKSLKDKLSNHKEVARCAIEEK